MKGAFARAALLYVALILVLTFPLVLHLGSTVFPDLGDPLLSESLLWWNARVLPLTERWWNGFAFAPATGMLAFSDHRLGLSLLASPLLWLGCSPTTAYNLVFLATFPLCALAANALAFTLTKRHDAALISGLAYGFNPYRMAHLAHLELLAAYAGKREEVTAVTEAAMRGELDFAQSLHARVAVLAGLPADVVESVRAEVRLTEGAAELVAAFQAAGHAVAVVSGGFNQILRPIAEDLGLHYWIANELEIVDGALTGKVLGDVIDRAAKEKYLREWAAAEGIPMEHTIAVGDGANDLDMLGAAGIGIAFNAKPAVRAAADAAVNLPYLDAVRYIAGV